MNASLEPASLHLPMGRALANAGGWAGSGELSLQPASLHLPMGRALANAGGWAGSGELSLMPASLHLPMGRALANARGRAGSGASSPTSHRKTEILYHVQHAADGDGCELRDLVHRDRALVRPMLGEGDGPGDSYQLPLVHGDGPGDSYKLPLVVGDGPGDSYQLPLVVGDGPGDSYKLPLVDGDEDGCGLRDLVQRDRDLSHPMLGEGDRPGDSYQLPLLGGDRHGLGYMLSDRDGGGEGEDGYGGFEAGKSKSGREIPLERCADRHGDTGPRSSDETSLDLYEDGHGGVAGRGYDEHPGGRGGTSLDGYEDGREGFEASGYDERPGKGVGSPLDGGLSPSHVAGDADSIYGEEGEEVPVSQSNKSERTPGNATLASHMLTPGDLAVSQMVGVDSPSSRECSPTPPVDVSVTTLASARFNKSSYDNPLFESRLSPSIQPGREGSEGHDVQPVGLVEGEKIVRPDEIIVPPNAMASPRHEMAVPPNEVVVPSHLLYKTIATPPAGAALQAGAGSATYEICYDSSSSLSSPASGGPSPYPPVRSPLTTNRSSIAPDDGGELASLPLLATNTAYVADITQLHSVGTEANRYFPTELLESFAVQLASPMVSDAVQYAVQHASPIVSNAVQLASPKVGDAATAIHFDFNQPSPSNVVDIIRDQEGYAINANSYQASPSSQADPLFGDCTPSAEVQHHLPGEGSTHVTAGHLPLDIGNIHVAAQRLSRGEGSTPLKAQHLPRAEGSTPVAAQHPPPGESSKPAKSQQAATEMHPVSVEIRRYPVVIPSPARLAADARAIAAILSRQRQLAHNMTGQPSAETTSRAQNTRDHLSGQPQLALNMTGQPSAETTSRAQNTKDHLSGQPQLAQNMTGQPSAETTSRAQNTKDESLNIEWTPRGKSSCVVYRSGESIGDANVPPRSPASSTPVRKSASRSASASGARSQAVNASAETAEHLMILNPKARQELLGSPAGGSNWVSPSKGMSPVKHGAASGTPEGGVAWRPGGGLGAVSSTSRLSPLSSPSSAQVPHVDKPPVHAQRVHQLQSRQAYPPSSSASQQAAGLSGGGSGGGEGGGSGGGASGVKPLSLKDVLRRPRTAGGA
eukprot:gene24833-10483_t